MIGSYKFKAIFFVFFISPAILCYSIFFIYPFLQGISYSFTDWNGIAPEVPISFAKDKFENEILPALSTTAGQKLKRFYTLDDQGLYRRGTLSSSAIDDIKEILESIGITPIKFVGFDNFREMFDSKLDPKFLPRNVRSYIFTRNSDILPAIESSTYKSYIEDRASKDELDLIKTIYERKEDNLILKTRYVETELFDTLYSLENIDLEDVDRTVEKLKEIAQSMNFAAADNAIEKLVSPDTLTIGERDRIRATLKDYFLVFVVKEILAKYMYKDDVYLGVIGFTIFFAFFNVVLANLVALILAVALDQKLKTSNFLRSIFFLPNILSLIIVAFVWSFIFNRILPTLTGIEVWLSDPSLAPYLVVFVAVWQGCGYLMVIYLAGLQGIPKNLLEASSIDGAKGLVRFFQITLPLLIPAITVCLFWSIANSLKTFDIIFALVGNSSYVTDTTPIVLDIYFDAFNRNRFGYATAKAILLCGVIIFFTSIQLYFMKRKETQL